MMRATSTLRIVPQAHAMMPHHCKIRGHLYRPSRLNFYCRLASTTRHQRSTMEEFLFITSLNSDVALTAIGAIGLGIIMLGYGYTLNSYSLNTQKNRQFSGCLNTSERFQRNTDMARIFDTHAKKVASYTAQQGGALNGADKMIPNVAGYITS